MYRNCMPGHTVGRAQQRQEDSDEQGHDRITSYNVGYTKLLRVGETMETPQETEFRREPR